MKELKINSRFEKFSPKKKPDEMEQLKNSLKTKGYISEKILTWHGFIVDGHNRYKICKELDIVIPDDCIEEIDLGDNAEEIDAMDWMLTHHLSSKNLSAGEKLALMDDFKEEVRLENERRKIDAAKKFYGNQHVDSTPIGVHTKKTRNDTWTDAQTSKKAGVGTGTVARYNKVMKLGDDKLKEQVKTGKVTVNKAYETIRQRENRTCKICGEAKKIVDFFGNDTICKDCTRKQSEESINLPKTQTSMKEMENMKDVYKDVLTAKNAKEHINQDYELNWLKDTCNDFIAQINDRFFLLLEVINKMDREHISEAYIIFEDFVSKVFDIQEKFNSKKEDEEN